MSHRATDPAAARPGLRRRDALAAVLILSAILWVAGPGLTAGGLGWSDAPQHVGDGLFVYRFIGDWPLDHPWQWARRFYLQYPSIGLIVYWPPGFALVEAAMFAMFGVSVTTARVTVLGFAFGACWLMDRLGRRWFGNSTGLFAALLLLTCPHGSRWLNDVMLEWPATFWILFAVWAYQKDRDLHRARWAVLFGAAAVGAFLTKQTAGFILPVLLVHALFAADRRRFLLRPALLISVVVAFATTVGYVVLTRRFTALVPQLLAPALDLSVLWRWAPEIIGWPLLPFAVMGGLGLFFKRDRGARGLLAVWLLAWTAFCLMISAKEPRYFFFSLPPLMFAAAGLFVRPAAGDDDRRLKPTRRAGLRASVLIALILVQALLVRRRPTGRLPDYAPAVAALADRPDADLVLVDAVRDGQFAFDVYQNALARHRIIPLRASKLLYARPARARWGYTQFVRDEREILALLDRYAIRYIVIESALPRTHYVAADPPPRKMLRRLLANTDRFTRLGAWPLRCDDPAWDNVELRLYCYDACPPRESKQIDIPVPAMNRVETFELP